MWANLVGNGYTHYYSYSDDLTCTKNKNVHFSYVQFNLYQVNLNEVFPGSSEVKASACNAGDLGSIPGSGRSPGEGNGNPLQYSCLENPMEPGRLQSTGSHHFHFQTLMKPLFKNCVWNYKICSPFSQGPMVSLGFPGGSVVKNPHANEGIVCLIPVMGGSSGEGNDNSLQYSCLGILEGYCPCGCKAEGKD